MMKCSRKTPTWSDLWVSSHDKLSDFYASSWQRGDSPIPLLVIRLMLLAVALGILAWSVYEGSPAYWFIYLTNWGQLLATTMLLAGAIVSILRVCNPTLEPTSKDSIAYFSEVDEGELPWYFSVYWFLHNVAITTAFVITTLYWTLLYDPDSSTEDPDDDTRMFWLDVMTHGFNSLLAFSELIASRTPMKALHFYQPLGVCLWYAAFSVVYYVAGGTDPSGNPFIYELVDWRYSRRSTSIVAASAGGLIVIYFVLYGVSICRDKVSTACIRTTSVELAHVPSDLQRFPNDTNHYV